MRSDQLLKWHVTQTLLGHEPGQDINRRYLCMGGKIMKVFNNDMEVWHEWQDEALQRACDELNKIEGQ